MSQHDFDIIDQTFAAFRADMNLAFKALASTSAGSSSPSAPFVGQFWIDTAATPWVLKMRNAANDAWINHSLIDDSDDTVSMVLKNLTASGAILGAGGSLGNVAIGRSADINTGLIFPAGDQMGLVAGGVQSALIKPASTLLQKAVEFSAALSPAEITVDKNDYDPTSLATTAFLRLTSDASRNITGLAGGVSGRLMMVVNTGSNNITLVDQSASSSAANRFLFATGFDQTLTPNQSVILRYDSITSRWRYALDTGSELLSRGTPLSTASGTAHGFTGIAANTNRITFMCNEVGQTASDEMLLQIGDSGGYETSGYQSDMGPEGSTSGFVISENSAAGAKHTGVYVLERFDANTWVGFGGTMDVAGGGVKTLTAELDRIQIVLTGAAAFDEGDVNIFVE